MRANLNNEVKVTRGAPIRARIAAPCQPDTLAIARAGLDAKLERLASRDDALATAGRTCILHLACAVAARALDVELHPPARLRHLAGAVTLRTLHRRADCL